MSQQREILTWEGFGVASHDLALRIAESGYEPDMILAIARVVYSLPELSAIHSPLKIHTQ